MADPAEGQAAAAVVDAAAPDPAADAAELGQRYTLAVQFYKDSVRRAEIDYDASALLMALHKQITCGPLDEDKEPALGWFDFVGHDRRAEWEELGDMPKEEAMAEFVATCEQGHEQFGEWLAEELAKVEAERVRLEQERLERERLERERLERERREREEQLRLEQIRQQEAAAAEQARQQALAQAAQDAQALQAPRTPMSIPPAQAAQTPGATNPYAGIKLDDFRNQLRDKPDFILSIGRGEKVRVRVPNPKPGVTQVSWIFCSELYDVGFGLDYEHQAEGGGEPVIEPLIPVERKESHEQLCFGSHTKAEKGNWLLVFDNGYSILRSKTVYYRCDLQHGS